MKNFAKRFSAMFLSLALVLTMMPLMAFESFAEADDAITVLVNGVEKKGVSRAWMEDEDNCMPAQVFPFASNQGGSWEYVVAKGPSYEKVLQQTLEIDSLNDIRNAQLIWRDASGNNMGKQGALHYLSVSDLMGATDQYQLIDGNGSAITAASGGFKNADADVVAVEVPNSSKLTPIIAVKSKHGYTYDEAVAALANSDWESGEGLMGKHRPYVGGNLSKDTVMKDDVEVKIASVNFTGRFAIENGPQLNVVIEKPTEIETGNMTFKVGDPAKTIETKYSDYEISALYDTGGAGANQVFECDDADVVSVDENGVVKPLAAGIAKVTLKVYADGGTVPIANLGEWTVTVEKAAPAVVNGQIAEVGGNTYQVVSAGAKTAAFTKAANKKSATVPATVKVNGETLKVTKIAPKAFNGTKVKTLTVKSKNLTKKSVKGSLKGSKVKTVKIKVGKKKDNKKYVKKYKKIFTKKNAGKKVTVK